MNHDRYGLPFSTASLAAASAYLDAHDRLLAADAGAAEALELAVGEDPDFALAHIALARAYQIVGQMDKALVAVGKAEAGLPRISEREQGHVQALAAVVRGAPQALDLVKRQIASHPKDALVLAPGVAVFGLIGFSGRQARNEELLQWMQDLAAHYHNDWWFGAWYGFLHTETGRFAQGKELVQQAFAQNPRNANAAHALAHVSYEHGDAQQGAAVLQSWLPRYHPAAPLHCHLSWHLALFALELGDATRAWQVFAASVSPQGSRLAPPLNTLTDSASFLWRAQLLGQRVSQTAWQDVVDFAHKHFAGTGLDFADVHKVMALVGAGQSAALANTLDSLRATPGKAEHIASVLAQALAAFGAQDWPRAIEQLEARADELVRVGGSGAQRDVFEHTLLAAHMRSQQTERAAAWLKARPPRPRNDGLQVLRQLAS